MDPSQSKIVPTKLEKIETLIQTFFLTNEGKPNHKGKPSYEAKEVYYLCRSIIHILKGK